ncbi:MAG: UDP-4-amino-4,6-dideoxy-N-acetyl-beta-L-altrosamine transaminase [Desulfovibrio sp.]
MIPYGRHTISQDDIDAVVEVLQSDWLTTGPAVQQFEEIVADYCGVQHGVAVCNGTAALHCAMYALGVGEGDEVIVPPITFAATANAVCYMGATPVFADVCVDSLLIDPLKVEACVTPKTKAIIAVDYTGQPCDWDGLKAIAKKHNLKLVADSCHAIGGEYKDRKVGQCADMSVFSFHPVKHVATGEGGMIVTDSDDYAQKMRVFRSHGITADFRQRAEAGSWEYDMVELGFNYRLTDMQCALGISQMKKLDDSIARRLEIAKVYDAAFAEHPLITSLKSSADVKNAYHLYVVKVGRTAEDRKAIFGGMREKEIGVNVHYRPVHLMPYYRETFGHGDGLCPVAEEAYIHLLSIPMYPALTDEEQEYVINALKECVESVCGQ